MNLPPKLLRQAFGPAFSLAPQSRDCEAKFGVVSVSQVPDLGIETIIFQPRIVELLMYAGTELSSGKGKAHVPHDECFAFLGSACPDLDALGEDTMVRLGVRHLIKMGMIFTSNGAEQIVLIEPE